MKIKALSLILTFCLLFTIMPVTAQEPENETPSATRNITPYMQLLIDLTFINPSDMPDKEKPIGDAFLTIAEKCFFYRPAIKTGNLTVSGACSVIMVLLGYEEVIKTYGSYLIGGEAAARREGLLSGITAAPNDILTAADAAKMFYNAFEIPFMGSDGYINGTHQAISRLSVCILDNIGLKRIIGTVRATHYTSQNSKIQKGCAQIKYITGNGNYTEIGGEDVFKINGVAPESLLGIKTEFFVTDYQGAKEVIAFRDFETSEIVSIDQDMLVDFQDGRFRYINEESEEENCIISPDAVLYVNNVLTVSGRTVTKKDLTDLFEPYYTLYREYGGYRLVDTDGDGIYEHIFAEVYKDYIVNAIDYATYRIDDKIDYTGQSIFFDPKTSGDFNVNFIKSAGEQAVFSDIAKGDVISVAASKTDGSNVIWATVVISKNSVTGTITEKKSKKIAIDGAWYKFMEIDKLRQDAFLFQLGDEGRFFINFKGVIIMKDLKALPLTAYAFVERYEMDNRFRYDLCLYANMLLSNGKWEVLEFAKYINLRDSDYHEILNTEDFCDRYLKDSAGHLTNNTRTLITYKLDSDGKIFEISFPKINGSGKNDKGRLTIDRKYNQRAFGENLPQTNDITCYYTKTGMMGDAFLTDKTVIFDFTLDDKQTLETAAIDEDTVNVTDISSIPNGAAPQIILFDMGDGNECSAVISINLSKVHNNTEHIFLVTYINSISVNGESRAKISGYENGEIKMFVTSPDVRIEKIPGLSSPDDNYVKPGDVIAYTLQSNGELKTAKVIFNTQKARNYLPNIYGDGSFMPPAVKIYEDLTNPRCEIKYYFGLVTEKREGDKLNKLTLAKNDNNPPNSYPFGLEEMLLFNSIIAADEGTVYYRVYKLNDENPIRLSEFSQIIADSVRNCSVRTGDLAFVKTVDGVAVDIITISP